MLTVDVMILTFRRPELLRRTLESLRRQELRPDAALRVIVVDNDSRQSGRSTVDDFRSAFDGLTYLCEPVQNVAIARNRALETVTADYCAFIDDDEAASATWLEALLEAHRVHRAPVVFGPVLPEFSAAAPEWFIRGAFLQRPRMPTGSAPTTGATGNVLMHTRTILRSGVRFDARFGKTGGEDTDFFERLRRAGVAWVWCDEAEVVERIGQERMNARWLFARSFRGGKTYARIFDSQQSAASRLSTSLSRLVIAALFCALAPLAALTGVARGVKVGQQACKNLGRALGVATAAA